jgi:hypothetical protein
MRWSVFVGSWNRNGGEENWKYSACERGRNEVRGRGRDEEEGEEEGTSDANPI